MKALLVKTSSLGDLIHTMPAITDAFMAIPGLELDWAVEDRFIEVCNWHSLVHKTLPVSFHACRKHLKSFHFLNIFRELKAARARIAAKEYDLVIDAQGLYKSALITYWAHGHKVGFSRSSLSEKLASSFYQTRIDVTRDMDIIERNRRLFADAFKYQIPSSAPDFSIATSRFKYMSETRPYILFIHSASWPTKSYPSEFWQSLAKLAEASGYQVRIPWYSPSERERAAHIAQNISGSCLVQVDLGIMGGLIHKAAGTVCVETGFAHLAAALGRPTVTLYGATGTLRHGTHGPIQTNCTAQIACSPCYSRKCIHVDALSENIPCMLEHEAEDIWGKLEKLLHRESKIQPN